MPRLGASSRSFRTPAEHDKKSGSRSCWSVASAVEGGAAARVSLRNRSLSSPVVPYRAEMIMTQLDPNTEENRLQADPELQLNEGRAKPAQIVLTAIGAL